MSFKQVVEKYGYPVISKEVAGRIACFKRPATKKNELTRQLYITGVHPVTGRQYRRLAPRWMYLIDSPFKISDKCCDILKKNPVKAYEKRTGKKPYIGIRANESRLRLMSYTKHGCNVFETTNPQSRPLSFWTEQDILRCIKDNNLPIAKIYGDIIEQEDGTLKCTGRHSTGCMFCAFGIQYDKEPNRFQELKEKYPRHYKICMEHYGMKEVIDYLNKSSYLNIKY